MIDVEFTDANVAVVTPKGDLTIDDFAQLRKAINSHIIETDKTPNLVVHTSRMPHWDGMESMREHIRFVRNHLRRVSKVGIVGDSLPVKIAPHLMDQFVSAKIRHFPEARLDEAKDWAASTEDHPGKFVTMDEFPDDVVAIRAAGIITSQDYRNTLVPLVDEKLKVHDRIKVLFVLDDDFQSYSAGAAVDDMRFGFSHLADFGKIALVTDIGWIRQGAKLLAPFIRSPVHIYDVADLKEAKSWIAR